MKDLSWKRGVVEKEWRREWSREWSREWRREK